MLNFFKEHSRPITKLITNQFGTAFFAFMLELAIPVVNLPLRLWASIFSVGFLLYLNHTVLWEEGAKSRIRADAGREKYNPLSGLWMGIFGALISILLGVLTALGFFLGNPEGLMGWHFAAKLSDVTGALAFLWQAQYIGITANIVPDSTYIYLLTPLPMILGCFVSYWIGLRQWQISSLFKLKKQDGKSDAKKPAAKK